MQDQPREYRSSLTHGVLTLSLPRRLTAEDVEEIDLLLELIMRQLRRVVDSAAEIPTTE